MRLRLGRREKLIHKVEAHEHSMPTNAPRKQAPVAHSPEKPDTTLDQAMSIREVLFSAGSIVRLQQLMDSTAAHGICQPERERESERVGRIRHFCLTISMDTTVVEARNGESREGTNWEPGTKPMSKGQAEALEKTRQHRDSRQ